MMYLVLDTNILVAALWTASRQSKAARVLDYSLSRRYQTLYTAEILQDYRDVLARPAFGFDSEDVGHILDFFKLHALPVDQLFDSLSRPRCADPFDQKFYDVACCCDALLVTGSKRHYPPDARVLSPTEFLDHRVTASSTFTSANEPG